MKGKKNILAVAMMAVALASAGVLSSAGAANAQNDDRGNERGRGNEYSSERYSHWYGWGHYFSPSYYFPSIIRGKVVSITRNRVVVRVGEGRRARIVSIRVTRDTRIIGDPSRGEEVRVIAYRTRSGYVAKRIKEITPGYGNMD
ncbi:MAG: hypothetical protein IPL87_02860 [Candidatus Moraniibacteriota bacterium]|nr:MAG: hypothetical protein IPL87_02860 [Candidatus Moranbacteria bacterium]